ncbi:1,4-alpha-glucan branching protein GlgB [[Mycoplasma] mobile]|uniref:1,4-alpha-glucan branching enzyme n=1 Tax=Mycoplasma mobile (strain ATCC 43663 / 163K / NCTC 11711) TaxID=267748 RepID=Q6KHP3_MYCM1|nr:1,4-alpha-glucan branching protein GlgB [[Mycoplasma] mobile]AAT27887.1 1,4-alpha-glucan branching enzyme [Mycoplasma mobile 163K]
MKNISSKNLSLNLEPFYGGYETALYKFLGSHLTTKNGKSGVMFRTWAPNAKKIEVLIANGEKFLLAKINEAFWEVFIPNLKKGTAYKYLVTTIDNKLLTKADPFAFYSNQYPYFDSIVYDLNNFIWSDEAFLKSRKIKNAHNSPILIYEVHLGSWKKTPDNGFLNYKDYSKELVSYLKKMNYTHVEFLPLFEHPFLGSWGYQITGFFSPTSRYGTPEELKYLINELHQNGIAVIFDFVPVHFCKDDHGLREFDGTNLFSYENEVDRENYLWGTQNFNLTKNEVKSFFTSILYYWIEEFHIDGVRFDAVSNLIYYGGLEKRGINNSGVNFIKHIISIVKKDFPNILMIAEDSSYYKKVTGDNFNNSLGFDLKWNLGFSNDLFEFIKKPYWERLGNNFHKLTFSMAYYFDERFLLAFSHDEVVHLKKSLLNKSFGLRDKQFSQIRLMLFYLITHPGKKLIFMGHDFAQFDEWNENKSLDWHLLNEDSFNLENKRVNIFSKELFSFYVNNKSLFELDFSNETFKWVHLNEEQGIWVFSRHSKNKEDFSLIVLNFSIEYFENYIIKNVPTASYYKEMINTDDLKFAGTGAINSIGKIIEVKNSEVNVKIAPLSGFVLKPFFKVQRKAKNE